MMHVNLPKVTLQCLLRSPLFTPAAILALIVDILLLRNSVSSSHFAVGDCGGVEAVLSSWSMVENSTPQFPAFSVII